MALRRKSSRSIHVDGLDLRWTVSPDSGYVVVVVQSASGDGRKLEVQMATDVGQFWVEFPDVEDLDVRPVTPAVVQRMVRKAVSSGWDPSEKGPPRLYRWEDDDLIPLQTPDR